jgi:hypothetical protein
LVLECEIAGKQDAPQKNPTKCTRSRIGFLPNASKNNTPKELTKPKNTLPTTTTTNCSRLLHETELKIRVEKNRRKESKSKNNSFHKKRKKERKRGSRRRRLKLKQSLKQQHKQKYNNKIT